MDIVYPYLRKLSHIHKVTTDLFRELLTEVFR